MALHINQWSPDTCGCIHEYVWNDLLAEDVRTHTYANAVKVCPEHAALGLSQASAFMAALENNQRKNQAIAHAASVHAAIVPDQVTFTWDAQRNITIQTGLVFTAPQRTLIQNALNTRFGVGKVTLG